MLEFPKKPSGVTALRWMLARMTVAGVLLLGCESGRNLEALKRSAQEPLKNFEDRPLTTFASCDALDEWDGIIDNENVVFPAGCTYHGQVKFMSGDVTLDCNSGSIEGSVDGNLIVHPGTTPEGAVANERHDAHTRYADIKEPDGIPNPQPLLAGIVIGRTAETGDDGCRLVGPKVEDITIRNCRVAGFYQGIRLERQLAYQLIDGECQQPHERTLYTGYSSQIDSYDEEYALERTTLYNHAPKRVRIIDSTIENNGHAGIYVMRYSQHFSIEGTMVRQNGSVGIYLSHESRYNTIDNSGIVSNGWGSNDENVDYRVPNVAEVARPSREGIAIDSSAHNTLSRNLVANNYKGGIALYKNCGEGHNDDDPAVIRKMHADYNRVVHNTIKEHGNRTGGSEASGYGIWIAMRQMQEFSEEDDFRRCRDPRVTVNGVAYNYDYANFNTVAYNSFEDNWCSVRVGDDFNQIVGNQFHGATKYDLYIGNTIRGNLGFPVRGTTVVKNRSWSVSTNNSGREIVLYAGSGDPTFFRGEMYYERGLGIGTQLHCLNGNDGAPFNDCARPPGQQQHGIFWD